MNKFWQLAEKLNVKKFQNANPCKVMKVREFFFKKINAFIMTDWKAQGFFEMMGNKDFRNFIYIDSSIAKPYLYDICLKCVIHFTDFESKVSSSCVQKEIQKVLLIKFSQTT